MHNCRIHFSLFFNAIHFIAGDIDYEYTRRQLNITFPAGVTCHSFEVPIINDKLSESDEKFYIVIMNESLPYGVNIGDHGNTTVTIQDNDG